MNIQPKEIAHVIEAILFVAGEPVLVEDIQKVLGITELEVLSAVDKLSSDYDYNRRGLCLKKFGSHIQLATRSDYAPFVEQMLQPVQRQSLSQAAMETLALVAYRQPVTKGEIEAVRGVKCDYSIQSLAKKELIQEVGRKETLGRPILYGTTDYFLSHFGLESLLELPPLPEKEEKDSPEEEFDFLLKQDELARQTEGKNQKELPKEVQEELELPPKGKNE